MLNIVYECVYAYNYKDIHRNSKHQIQESGYFLGERKGIRLGIITQKSSILLAMLLLFMGPYYIIFHIFGIPEILKKIRQKSRLNTHCIQ